MIKFSMDVIHKGRELLAEPGAVEDLGDGRWAVQGSAPGVSYRVQTDYDRETDKMSWVSCTCRHGMTAGGGSAHCYHAAAVLITLLEEK